MTAVTMMRDEDDEDDYKVDDKGKTTMRCIGKSLNEFQSNVNDRPTTLGEAW